MPSIACCQFDIAMLKAERLKLKALCLGLSALLFNLN